MFFPSLRSILINILRAILNGDHFGDFRRPKFLYIHPSCRRLVNIYQNRHQTFWPRSCRVNQYVDTSWILESGLFVLFSNMKVFIVGGALHETTAYGAGRWHFSRVFFIVKQLNIKRMSHSFFDNDSILGILSGSYLGRYTYRQG